MTIQEYISQAVESLRSTTASPRYRVALSQEDTFTLLHEAYMADMRKRGVEMPLDPETINRITSVSRWLTASEMKPGLLLCGGIGNGKTTMLRAMWNFEEQIKRFEFSDGVVMRGVGYRNLRLITASMIAETAGSDEEAYRIIMGCPLLGIDDLGCEPVSIKRFGTEVNPVIDVICYRYEKRLPTIITTNLSLERIGEVYGERVQDRLKEMCEKLIYKTLSYRQ